MNPQPRPTPADDLHSRAGRRGVSALVRGPGALATALLVLVAGVAFAGGRLAATTALFTDSAMTDVSTFATPPDWVAPTTTEATIAVDGGALPAGTVYRSTTYRTYANATDDGGVPSGVAAVTADVSTITAGATSVAMTAGSWTVDGITYGWRSGPIVAASTLAPGTAAWSVTATDAAGNAGTQPFSVIIDTAGPTVSGAVIAPTGSTVPGFIRQAGSYQVYALVSDPVAAIATVTANASTITTGSTAIPLTATGGPWVIGGTSYNYRSASVTANTTLAAGARTFAVAAVDTIGTSGSGSGSVTVDNTAPTVLPVALLPETGATVPGFIRAATAYRVYASATDATSGVATVTANVSTVTAGQTAVALTKAGGPWTVNGVSYAWRSASITSDAVMAIGAKAWSVTTLDVAGNSATGNGSSTVDGTAPTVSGVLVARAGGTNPTYLSKSTGYYLYANASDAASGIGSIVANASTLTTGATAVTLSSAGGPFTANAVSYTYRSALLTTDATLADGVRSIPFTAYDNAGGSTSLGAAPTVDATPPSVTEAQIIRTTGVVPGFIKRSTTFYVYAAVTDANLSTVTANVSAIRTGTTALALSTTGGPWTVDGVTYTHRSASTTASSTIVDGTVAWTLTATDLATNATVANRTAVIDNTAPVRTAATIAPAAGSALGGFIRQGGNYYIYAQVTDAGSGVATVTANTSAITTGATATAMTTVGGPWTVGGVSYSHRTATPLTANTTINQATRSYSVTAVDALATSGSTTFSARIDNASPTGITSVIAKASGLVGIVSSGTTYYVYANATDAISGVSSITANVGSLTTGATAVTMSTAGGPWTVGATSYSWRSAPIVANAGLVNGTASYSLSGTDNASNTATPAFTVTINNASPGADAADEGILVNLVALGPRGPAGTLIEGSRYRFLVSVDGARVRSVSVDASALATGAKAPDLVARKGLWVSGRVLWPWRTQRIIVAGTAYGSLPVVVTLELKGGRTLVTTLAVPVRAASTGTGGDPVPTPTPTPSPEPTPDPGTDPTPAPTQDPGTESTPAPSPTPEATPAPTPTPEPTQAPTPEPTPDPTPAPTPEPTQAPATPEPASDTADGSGGAQTP